MGIAQILKFKPTEQDVASEKKPDVTLPDFIPYAAFLNPETILTKNGELMQILRITTNQYGLPTEDVSLTGVYLREAIRNALQAAFNDAEFSVWLHVTRNRISLDPLSKPQAPFAVALQEEWMKKQRTKFVYQNVCYLTVLVSGKPLKLLHMEDLKNLGLPSHNRQQQEKYTQQSQEKLDAAMQIIHQHLAKDFGVSKLSMTTRNNPNGEPVYYSEQLEFLHRIMNLAEQPMPVQKMDLSTQLSTHELIFGFDALETKKAKDKRFASIVSIKHLHELPCEILDRFSQMPAEMIITQTFNFVSTKKALAEIADIKNVLQRSKDGYIAHASGFLDILNANQNTHTDFGEQQTTIMLMTDHYQELDGITTELQSIIAKIGLVSVREDIKFEEVFWSQLPGNFEFIRRSHMISASKNGALARLNYYLVGELKSRWGEPITILPTDIKTPYLFHFHREQSGHTVLVDYNSFPDAISYRLTHFLCASASKQVPRIIMFDRHGSGEMFTDAMQGQYLHVGGNAHSLTLNPLAMSATPPNQNFLAAWMATLLKVGPEDTEARQALKACAAQAWAEATSTDGLIHITEVMQHIHPGFSASLRQQLSQPVFQRLFGTASDNFDLRNAFTTINLHKECFTEGAHFAAFALMLHRIILALDGTPTLIVIKEAWDILTHPFFASRLTSLSEMLTEQNAALFLTTRDVDKLAQSPVTKDILQFAVTRIFLPDDIASDHYADIVGLNQAEDKMLLKMERQKGDFIIKHGRETIPTRFKLDDAKMQAVLLGDAKTLHGMRTG